MQQKLQITKSILAIMFLIFAIVYLIWMTIRPIPQTIHAQECVALPTPTPAQVPPSPPGPTPTPYQHPVTVHHAQTVPTAPAGDNCNPELKSPHNIIVKSENKQGCLTVHWWPSDAKYAHIKYKMDGQEGWPYSLLDTDNDGHQEVCHLQSKAHYWFSVASVSRKGWGACVSQYTKPYDPLVP